MALRAQDGVDGWEGSTPDARDASSLSNLLSRVLRNFAWLTAGSILSQVAGAAALIYVSRRVGPLQFGMLALAQALANLGLTVADIGLGRVGTRAISRSGSSTAVVDVVALRTIVNLVFVLAVVDVTGIVRVGAAERLIIVLTCFSTLLLALDPDFAWMGLQRMSVFSSVLVVRQLIRAGAMLALVSVYANVLIVPVATIVAGLIGAMLSWSLLRKTMKLHMRPNLSQWPGYLAVALPIGLAALMPDIYINSDALVVNWLRGARSLGQFSAGYRILLIVLTVAGLYVAAAFPTLCQAVGRRIEFGRLVSHSTLLLVSCAIPIALAGILFGRQLISLLYGSAYQPAAGPLPLLLCVPIVALPNLILSASLVAKGDTRFNLIAIGAGGVLNLAFDVMLLPAYGITGAAIATLIAECAVGLCLWLRLTPRLPLRATASVLLASAFMVALGVGLAQSAPFLGFGLGLIAYVAILVATGTVRDLTGIPFPRRTAVEVRAS